jgi:hypothetical protein
VDALVLLGGLLKSRMARLYRSEEPPAYAALIVLVPRSTD